MNDAQQDRLTHLREDYDKGELLEEMVPSSPHEIFTLWMDQAIAAGVREPNALSLGTVDSEGQPSVRIVLLRAHDDQGFVFYTNYESRKGGELESSGKAALTFFWPGLGRQVLKGRLLVHPIGGAIE